MSISWRRTGAWARHELTELLIPTIFFALSFNLIVFSMNLVLAQYYLQLGSFLVATTMALIVGKAVLVADKVPQLRRFNAAPLIWPILFKTVVYWFFVLLARLVEGYVEYVIHSGRVVGFGAALRDAFSWRRFAFIQLWILVLFLVYVAASTFVNLAGRQRVLRLLFRDRSAMFAHDGGPVRPEPLQGQGSPPMSHREDADAITTERAHP